MHILCGGGGAWTYGSVDFFVIPNFSATKHSLNDVVILPKIPIREYCCTVRVFETLVSSTLRAYHFDNTCLLSSERADPKLLK